MYIISDWYCEVTLLLPLHNVFPGLSLKITVISAYYLFFWCASVGSSPTRGLLNCSDLWATALKKTWSQHFMKYIFCLHCSLPLVPPGYRRGSCTALRVTVLDLFTHVTVKGFFNDLLSVLHFFFLR